MKKLSGVSVDIWIEEGRQLPRALPKWTVSPPLSKNLLVQCFYKYGTRRFVGKDACTIQTSTGMRAQPKIHCETESSQGAYGAVKYLLCTTLCTPVHLYFNVMEQIDITDIHCSVHNFIVHGVQIIYTPLQVGFLCDISQIGPLRQHLVSMTRCCRSGPIWQMSHSVPPCNRVYNINTCEKDHIAAKIKIRGLYSQATFVAERRFC